MLRHLRGQHPHERMRVRHLRATLERVGGFLVILEIHVIDEAQVVVELPVVGIILNAVLHQPDRLFRLARTIRWWWCQKTGAKLVGHYEMRIKLGCDLQQGKKQIVALGIVMMPSAKILHGTSPIDVGKKAVIAQTGSLQYRGRTQEQDFFDSGARTKLVGAMKEQGAGSQGKNETAAGDERNFAALIHFRFRCSKMSTAPLSAMAA